MALVALAVDVALLVAGFFAVRRTMRRMLGSGFPLGVRTAGSLPTPVYGPGKAPKPTEASG